MATKSTDTVMIQIYGIPESEGTGIRAESLNRKKEVIHSEDGPTVWDAFHNLHATMKKDINND